MHKTANYSCRMATVIRGCHSAAALCVFTYFVCLLDSGQIIINGYVSFYYILGNGHSEGAQRQGTLNKKNRRGQQNVRGDLELMAGFEPATY